MESCIFHTLPFELFHLVCEELLVGEICRLMLCSRSISKLCKKPLLDARLRNLKNSSARKIQRWWRTYQPYRYHRELAKKVEGVAVLPQDHTLGILYLIATEYQPFDVSNKVPSFRLLNRYPCTKVPLIRHSTSVIPTFSIGAHHGEVVLGLEIDGDGIQAIRFRSNGLVLCRWLGRWKGRRRILFNYPALNLSFWHCLDVDLLGTDLASIRSINSITFYLSGDDRNKLYETYHVLNFGMNYPELRKRMGGEPLEFW